MITLSIDVTQLDKRRFKEITRKNGDKAIFCDLVIFESKSGKMFVKQQVSKEERAQNVQMPILGEAKDWAQSNARTPAPAAPRPQPESEDVPF